MKDFFVFDGHCDTPMELWEKKTALAVNSGKCDLRRGSAFSDWAQFFAFCTPCSNFADHLPTEQILLDAYSYFCRQLQQNDLPICADFDQMMRSLQQHHVACMLSLEGGEGIGCDPGKLELLHQMGFSAATLTWNAENVLAGSHKTGQGLSARGREFVHKAQKLGIMVDVSHISDRAFWQICEIAEKPIVASHSNSRTVCDHSRNLTDDMYRAICQLGGVVGMNFFAPFLDEKQADLETIWRHLDHFMQLAGSDAHVALGGDLDGCDQLAGGIAGMESYPDLADYLSAKGLSNQTLRRLYHENLMGVYQVCTGKTKL